MSNTDYCTCTDFGYYFINQRAVCPRCDRFKSPDYIQLNLKAMDTKEKAIKKKAQWLAYCLEIGWEKSQLDELSAVWDRFKDEHGNIRKEPDTNPANPRKEGDNDEQEFKYPSYEQAGGNKPWDQMSELEQANYNLCRALNALVVSRTTIKRLREKPSAPEGKREIPEGDQDLVAGVMAEATKNITALIEGGFLEGFNVSFEVEGNPYKLTLSPEGKETGHLDFETWRNDTYYSKGWGKWGLKYPMIEEHEDIVETDESLSDSYKEYLKHTPHPIDVLRSKENRKNIRTEGKAEDAAIAEAFLKWAKDSDLFYNFQMTNEYKELSKK